MKTLSVLPFSFVLMLIGAALIPITANGQVWSNPSSGTWEWQDASNWGGTAPSISQSATFITNAVTALSGSRFRTISIDSTTSSGSISTMTINNLTIEAPGSGIGGSHNALFLNNAGLATPLHILNSLTITSGGAVNIMNSGLTVDGPLVNDNSMQVINGSLAASASSPTVIGLNVPGSLTITNSTFLGAMVQVGNLTASTLIANDSTLNGTFSVEGGTMSVSGGHLTNMGEQSIDGQMTASNVIWQESGGEVTVGNGGMGTLTVIGGTSTFENLVVAASGTSVGAMWLIGGQMTVSGGGESTQVGEKGRGQLTVSNAALTVDSLEVSSLNGVGTLSIAGSSATVLSTGSIMVASDSRTTGTVWLTDGQLIAANGDTILGGGVVQMIISNGTWRARDVVLAASDMDGTLTMAGGTSSIYSNFTIGDCALDGSGIVFIHGGSLFVTNASHNATLDVRNGFILITSGHLVADRVVMTNDCGLFIQTGGSVSVASVLLDPNLDADEDGLPNGWEQAHGLNPLSSMGNDGADGDPDGDGLSNLEEYQLGTDPLDRTSPYHITAIQRQGNDVLVTWTTVNGKTNVIQCTHGTANGSYSNNFADLSPQIITPGCFCVANSNYLDVGGATNSPARYYRVRVVR